MRQTGLERAEAIKGVLAAVSEVEGRAFDRGALAVVEALERAIEGGVPPLNAIAIVKGQLVEERFAEGVTQ